MPNPDQIILGKRRAWWVWQAAKACIAATDPALLWQIIDAGFDAFLPKARATMPKSEPAINFSTDEYRWMFLFMAKHIRAEMAAHGGVARSSPEQAEDTRPVDYSVETATSPSRLVH